MVRVAVSLRPSPDRADREEVERQGRAFATDYEAREVFDAVPVPFFVANQHRQVVFANRALLTVAGVGEEEALARRPGEVLSCLHADEAPGGCGTAAACTTCDAVAAVRSALQGQATCRDCRITLKGGASLDLRMTATPVRLAGQPGALVAVLDISDENRRRALERIFFHDVLNTAGGVRGLVEVIQETPAEQHGELLRMLDETSDRLIGEIQAQRLLAAAEHGDLSVRPGPVSALGFVNSIARTYHNHETAAGRDLTVDPGTDDADLWTDAVLLARVAGNLVINALEASEPGMTVTLGCRADAESVALWVHNPTAMPLPEQLQMFQRSFSTKGAGRGLGTYSVRLLTEGYLGGRVSFTSSEETGTTFTVRLPRRLEAPAV